VALTFHIRTQVGGPNWHGPKVEITGPWIQRHDKAKRLGTALLIVWDQATLPSWLTDVIEAHRPTWRPELPPAVIPRTG
jgi:hypothetical protein